MRRGRPRHPELLTPREQEVLSLIRQGLTNAQIAERLGISESGARYHVSEILSKLGVSTRAEAAAWQPEPSRRGMPVLGPLTAGVLAAGVASLAVVVLVAITLGSGWLSDDDNTASVRSSQPASPGDEGLGALLGLAAEAEVEARAVLPDAYLYAIAYPETSGLYTFRFHEPKGLREFGVVGPYANDSSFPLWELYEDTLPPGSPSPEALDPSRLDRDLRDIMDRVRAELDYSGDLAIVVWSEAGIIRWSATPAVRQTRSPALQCEGRETPRSMACETPTSVP